MTPDQVDNLKAGDFLYRGVGNHVIVFKIDRATANTIYPEFGCEATRYRSQISKSKIVAQYSITREEAAEMQMKHLNESIKVLKKKIDDHEMDCMELYEKLKAGEL